MKPFSTVILLSKHHHHHREAVRLCAGRRIKINLLKKVTAAAASARKDFLSGVDLLGSLLMLYWTSLCVLRR
jgi:hypothetical protein